MRTLPRPTIDKQKEFWNWHWAHWEERRTINEWKQTRHEMILRFLEYLSLDRPRILDLGCGPGWYTDRLANYGPTVGVDLSEKAIETAKVQYPRVKFMAGDLYNVPLTPGSFDVVVSQEVIDHVDNQVAFVERVAFLLRPQGYFILSCTNKFVMDRLRPGEFPTQPPAHIADYLDKKALRLLLRPYFRIVRAKTIIPIGSRGILRVVNSHKLNTLLGFIIPRPLISGLKERLGFGYQIIALAQKKL